MIEFEILGEACAKGRPRFRSVGKYVKPYNTEKTTNYENLVKLSFINSGCEPILEDEPLCASLEIYVEIPKSASKKKRNLMLEGSIRPTKKPDLDNVAKAILDALNGVAFNDDKNVVELHVVKRYAEQPKARVVIERIFEKCQ